MAKIIYSIHLIAYDYVQFYFKLEWDPKKIKEDMKIKAKEKVIPSNDDSDGRINTLPIMRVKSKVHQNNKYYSFQIVNRIQY